MTRYSRPRFYLGTQIDGRIFQFNALGFFRSVAAARDKAHSTSRNGDVHVYSERDCIMSPTNKTARKGRPPTDGTTRTRAVMVRLTPAEHRAWTLAAERDSRTVAEWARVTVERARSKP